MIERMIIVVSLLMMLARAQEELLGAEAAAVPDYNLQDYMDYEKYKWPES